VCWGVGAGGCRRVLSLIRGLPPESSLARGDTWDVSTELSALTVDLLNNLTYYYMTANGGTPDQPDPVRRPDYQPDTVSRASQIAAFLKE